MSLSRDVAEAPRHRTSSSFSCSGESAPSPRLPHRASSAWEGENAAGGGNQRHSLHSVSSGPSEGEDVPGQVWATDVPDRRAELAECFRGLRRKAAPRCRSLVKSKAFQASTLVALVLALFLPDLWVVFDRPDNSDLDIILTFVLVLFLVELALQSVGFTRTYWRSFFFWTDLFGAASMLFDLSYTPLAVQSSAGESQSNVVILKTARVVKLAVRAGRFTKLVKLLRFLPGMRPQDTGKDTARVISATLMMSLSKRVSCLIIVLVMVMPLFSLWVYPAHDWSMETWIEVLEAAMDEDSSFAEQVGLFGAFYGELTYYPYRLELKPGVPSSKLPAGVLPWLGASRGAPVRATNSVEYQGKRLRCDFNFEQPNQMVAAMQIAVLFFIIVVMVTFAMMLSSTVQQLVLQPLERLLLQVRKLSSTIFQSVSDMAELVNRESSSSDLESGVDSEGVVPSSHLVDERLLLEKVVHKLAFLAEIAVQRPEQELKGLAEGDRQMIWGFHGQALDGEEEHPWARQSSTESMEEAAGMELTCAQKALIENAGLSLDLVNSDSLNTLELDRSRNQAAAQFFLGKLHHGVSVDALTLQQFLEAAEGEYRKETPYHNWYHAVDVAHGVYRLLRMCAAEAYLGSPERFALLVSAVCHDMGHPGLNNPFLAETSHELALRYNDKSPLENMHCALLFELVGRARCNVFAQLARQQFLEARKTCIEAILHTDNVHHFAMIKEVQLLYEMNSEMLDLQAGLQETEQLIPSREAVECFRQSESKKLLTRFFLHFADISNPMRPFRICRIWAWKITDEFFLQGDREKQLGLPVQALNDREKVNRPFSQVGFIEFLVAPLAFAAIKVFPPIESWADRLVENAKAWHGCWVTETSPMPPDEEQKAVWDRIQNLQVKFLEGTKQLQ